MKINNVPGIVGAYQQRGARKVAPEQEVARTTKGDGVVLSREAQEVRALKEKLNQVSDVRQDRIEELRRQVQAGTYRPDGREIASKMLQSRVFDDLA